MRFALLKMINALSLLTLLCLLFAIDASNRKTKKPIHQFVDYTEDYGWREGGFTRPIWIIDREIIEDDPQEGEDTVRRDRIYVKFKVDQRIRVLKSSDRPFVEFLTRPQIERAAASEMSETDSKDPYFIDTVKRVDGRWKIRNEAPKPTVKVELDIDDDIDEFQYHTRSTWGKADSYAVNFRRGTMYEPYLTKEHGSLKYREVGTFIMRANVFRPRIQDFYAFQ